MTIRELECNVVRQRKVNEFNFCSFIQLYKVKVLILFVIILRDCHCPNAPMVEKIVLLEIIMIFQ